MFDIGWLELIIIGIVALIVVGPNDLPGMFRNAGRFMGKMRGMAREFQRAMEDAANESGVKEAVDGLNKIQDVANPTRSAKTFAKDFMKDTGLDDLDEIEADLNNAAEGSATGSTSKPKPKPKSPVPPAAESTKSSPPDSPAEPAGPAAAGPAAAAAAEKSEG